MNSTLFFLLPVFNDWESFERLIREIDNIVPAKLSASIMVVNDCSDSSLPEECFHGYKFKAIKSIRVLDLAINMGHQRAIAIGLSEIAILA